MIEKDIAQAIDEALWETVAPHSTMGEREEVIVYRSLAAGHVPDWIQLEEMRRELDAANKQLDGVKSALWRVLA